MLEVEAKLTSTIIGLIGNAERLRMIQAMLEEEVRVGALAERTGLTQSATSQHLAKFLVAGIVIQRRDQQSRYNSVAPKWVDILRRLITVAEEQAILRTTISP